MGPYNNEGMKLDNGGRKVKENYCICLFCETPEECCQKTWVQSSTFLNKMVGTFRT